MLRISRVSKMPAIPHMICRRGVGNKLVFLQTFMNCQDHFH
jgi:hypothetical protein